MPPSRHLVAIQRHGEGHIPKVSAVPLGSSFNRILDSQVRTLPTKLHKSSLRGEIERDYHAKETGCCASVEL